MMKVTNTHLHYRSAIADDIPMLKKLGVLAYGQLATRLSPENWDKMKNGIGSDDLWNHLLTNGSGFVCCNDTGDIVGMAFLLPSGNPWDVFPDDWSYIRMVGVHPHFGGMGIGHKLTQQCIDAARNKGERIIALHTSEIMDAARHIYEKLGFEVVKEIASRFEIRYWLYKMLLQEPLGKNS